MDKIIEPYSFWKAGWQQFRKRKIGLLSLLIICLFCLAAIYAPFLASNKPLFVSYHGHWYFPLFRYLLNNGFYTKPLDIFFNLLIFTLPLFLCSFIFKKKIRKFLVLTIIFFQCTLFLYFAFAQMNNPASSAFLNKERQQAIRQASESRKDLFAFPQASPSESWDFELKYMTNYAKLNLVLRNQNREQQHKIMDSYMHKESLSIPSTWQLEQHNEQKQLATLNKFIEDNRDSYIKEQQFFYTYLKEHSVTEEPSSEFLQARSKLFAYEDALARISYIEQKNHWLQEESQQLQDVIMPLLRPFHWQEDAGGNQKANQYLPWWELTRTNRKDLVASLIFGTRISLVVGVISISLALLIGIPIGACAGFYGGSLDIVICRLIEIWESMPTFFMLLLVVAMMQSKSIFLVMTIIGLFGWTGFCRYTRGEFFKQRNLPYVEACRATGFNNGYTMFFHILPNAIPPVLTLMPFAIMGAITSEAGLSFLGLGEEGSCSWGVLMDEGRAAFPGESYLLWPPAILLSTLLIAIALVGDALRDTLDPKLHIS